MVLWDKVFYEVAKEYEGVVEHDKMLVDAMTVRMVNRPESMDVIVATNRKLLQSRSILVSRVSELISLLHQQCTQISSPT